MTNIPQKSEYDRNTKSNITDICDDIYRETACFYKIVAHKMNGQALGFKIYTALRSSALDICS
jgi:hypothetical protein